MKTIITTGKEDREGKFLAKEREDIRLFQATLDRYADWDLNNLPSKQEIEENWSDIIDGECYVVLNRSVAVHVTDVETARQYLWDCACWATKLNLEGRGVKIGTLPSGQDIFCHHYAE
jgi:hypothetical protein